MCVCVFVHAYLLVVVHGDGRLGQLGLEQAPQLAEVPRELKRNARSEKRREI